MPYNIIDPNTNLTESPSTQIANSNQTTETTVALAASASFTGAAHDLGSTFLYDNRVRLLVSANAGMGFGHVAIEESTDNVTFREVQRFPVPSDGAYYTFEVALQLRYFRVRFYNGATAQTSFFLSTTMVPVDGNVDFTIAPVFMHTNMALGASATFTGVSLNISTQNPWNLHRAYAYADQAGTLYLEQSMNGSMWRTTSSVAVAAGTTGVLEDKLVAEYCRVRFVNGATAQGSFEIMSTLIHA
jgi:hypothetical protein